MHVNQLPLISVCIGFALVLGACGGDSLTLPSDGEAARIEVYAGGGQQGRVTSELGEPLAVKVTDTQNRPIIGAAVGFALEDGSGSIATPPSATTGDSGIARTTITLGPRVGTVTGQAWVAVEEGQTPVRTDFIATALPADANGIVIMSGQGQTAAVGTVLPESLVVKVTDAFGNPIPGFQVNWAAEGGGSVSAEFSQTDDAGQTWVKRTLGPVAGSQTTSASGNGLAGSPIIFNHTATAGNAARVVVVDGNGQEAAPGATLPKPLVVQVLDAEDNPIVNRAVAWVIGTGEGSVSPPSSDTDGQGRASTQWTLGAAPGRHTVTAVVSGVGTAQFNATATKTASSTAITAHQPDPSTVGAEVQVQVQVTGSGGTPTGTVTVSGEAAGQPCTFTLSNGSGACSITFNAEGQRRITATYSGDGRFNGSNDTADHQVEATNTAPTAAFNPPTCTVGEPCQFSDGSSDADGQVEGWLWEFGDGGTSDQKDPTHEYATPGDRTVKLVVRDDDGATAEVTHTVTVNAAPNFAPVANDDFYTTTVGTSFHAPDATRPGLLANDADLEGNTLSTSSASGVTTAGGTFTVFTDGSFDYAPPPSYTGEDRFDYTVTDGLGGSDIGTAIISVAP